MPSTESMTNTGPTPSLLPGAPPTLRPPVVVENGLGYLLGSGGVVVVKRMMIRYKKETKKQEEMTASERLSTFMKFDVCDVLFCSSIFHN